MAKIKLGSRPKTFLRTVKFPMVDGPDGEIVMTYTYRTRSELATLTDEFMARQRKQADDDTAEMKRLQEAGEEISTVFTAARATRTENERNADFIMDAASGWNLDIPMDREAVLQLADEIPGAIIAIISNYRDAIQEGRRGN